MSQNTYRHDPEFRTRMRGLLQGFIEHCEISPSLIGRIERFVHFEGRKYGVPVFTVFGPPQERIETEFVGLIGVNTNQDSVAADTLLQLIERLALQPHIAAGHILRIVPVSDPVRLERDVPAEDAASASHREGTAFAFPDGPLDGLIEVRLTDDSAFQIHAEGPVEVLQAVLAGEEALARLGSEDGAAEIHARGSCVQRPGNWRLQLGIPKSWPSSVVVHWASQMLVVFFRTRVALLTAIASSRCAGTYSGLTRTSVSREPGFVAGVIEPSTIL